VKEVQTVLREMSDFPQIAHIDRRESARIVLFLDVELQPERTDSVIKAKSGNMNMDGSGIMVKANEELSPGQRLKLKIFLPQDAGPVCCEGAVIYCFSSPLIFKQHEQIYQIGISIDELDFQNLSLLYKFITEKIYS